MTASCVGRTRRTRRDGERGGSGLNHIDIHPTRAFTLPNDDILTVNIDSVTIQIIINSFHTV